MFRHVTWPQLRTTSAAVALLLLISAFQAFDEFYNLLGDARATLRELLPMLRRKEDRSWRESVEEGVRRWWT